MKTIAVKKEKISIKAKTLWIVAVIVSAVALPQIMHFLGIISGLETALGEVFLPMHLPVILAGFLAGPAVGAIAGLFAPLISHSLTAMPSAALLPFMTAELCIYGLCAGLLKDVNVSDIIKVLAVQIVGRGVRAVLIVISVYLIHISSINVNIIWLSIKSGIIGIILQLVLIPLILYRVKGLKENEQ